MGRETEREMLIAFERSLEVAGIRTHGDYTRRVEQFLLFAREEGFGWEMIPEGLVHRYTKIQLEEGTSRRTVNNKISSLKKWGAWLVKSRRASDNPVRYVEPLRVGPWVPKHILGIDEMGIFLSRFRMRTQMDIMVKAILELLYGSGIRISEAVSITEGDIDYRDCRAKIFETKTQTQRHIRLTQAFVSALEFYYQEARTDLTTAADREEGRVFPKKAATTLRVRINSIIAREAQHLGMEKITSHSMRHMAATHLLKNGAGIRHVQAFLGHESITTTQGYTRVCKDELKKVIETCHPLEARYVDADD